VSVRRPKRGNSGSRSAWWEAPWLGGLLLLAVAAYLVLSLRAPGGAWWRELEGQASGPLLGGDNPGGPVGALLSLGLHVFFGAAWCWAVPLLLAATGIAALLGKPSVVRPWLLRGAALWLVTAAWLAQPGGPLTGAGEAARWGGAVGFWLARGVHSLFGLWGGRIFLTVAVLVSLLAQLHPWLDGTGRLLGRIGAPLVGFGRAFAALGHALGEAVGLPKRWWRRRRARRSAEETVHAVPGSATARERRVHLDPASSPPDEGPTPPEPAMAGKPRPEGAAGGAGMPRRRRARKASGPVSLPGLDLLSEPESVAEHMLPAELDTAADLLEDTLRSFGVTGEVKDVRPGPVVTTFEYQPGSGTRVSQIVQRADDLALAMRARSLRLEAPIPGKAAVGIEIPNPRPQIVRLKEVLRLVGNGERGPLNVALGKDVVGQPVSIDIATLPHLLVAGSTGSGKSVCLNALICNLLLTNDPRRLRLLLIDPKMLELNVYNGIPHLLLPVVTDPKEALRAMKWLVAQMDLRYRQLAHRSVRNIEEFNQKVERGEVEDREGEVVKDPMPYLLCIVDELADLMIQLGQEFELPVTRLAQKARAVGIHLVLATQRPSVDVLTGVIKANIPCRIAFRVIQKNDSRTILDLNGAEQLLGRGDMLYLEPGRAQPRRVHGVMVDGSEAEAIAAYWREHADLTEEIEIDETGGSGGGIRGEDDLYDEARSVVVLHQSGSTSLLQRRLRVGYTRAGRLMDMLEEAGVVGPFTGSKARDVLLKPEDLPDPNHDEAEG